MIIKTDELEINITDTSDPEIKQLIKKSEDLENLSETRIYPDKMPTDLSFRIEKNGELIGEIKLNRIRWFNRKAELSILISKEFQNKGYGKMALKEFIKYAFQKMNLHRLEAEVIEFNERGIKLVEKLGFKSEGRLREAQYMKGRYWDILRYGILKNEFK